MKLERFHDLKMSFTSVHVFFSPIKQESGFQSSWVQFMYQNTWHVVKHTVIFQKCFYFYLLYLCGCSEHDELDGAPGVSLRRHGASQRLHGGVVGASYQRLAVHCYHLVVDTQSTVLLAEEDCDIINILPRLSFNELAYSE